MSVHARCRCAERRLVQLVRDGAWEIDEAGCVWRVMVRVGQGIVPCDRRRVEILRPEGYLWTRAVINGRRETCGAHRLVWQWFFGDIPEGMFLNHKNGQKADNRPSNLEVVTPSENVQHAHRNGLVTPQSGERHYNSKLSDREVVAIREAYAGGAVMYRELAAQYGIDPRTVRSVVKGSKRRTPGGPISNQDERRRRGTFTADQVRMIHRSDLSDRVLARQLGVSKGAIWAIRVGKTWKIGRAHV